jgi:hypothetical protein
MKLYNRFIRYHGHPQCRHGLSRTTVPVFITLMDDVDHRQVGFEDNGGRCPPYLLTASVPIPNVGWGLATPIARKQHHRFLTLTSSKRLDKTPDRT